MTISENILTIGKWVTLGKDISTNNLKKKYE